MIQKNDFLKKKVSVEIAMVCYLLRLVKNHRIECKRVQWDVFESVYVV